ncbi:hypothetical protein DRE_05176 [Drechslerella stenobrocha 248]|uniref:SAC3/GANP/THP3 conserved domain-containing protein n=1 Tax=Drechslerella stenobrocha 248 TaxID=1043628 RepID=W7I9A5_9PEZI|nr:hypothetical protein DRE_05176 [Drechslerella stenobrocha 248]
MKDSEEDWPTNGHQREVFGFRNGDFTSLVPTRVTQYVSVEQRQELELSRPAKPPVNTSLIRHELIHPSISEEDMFKDALQERKKRVEEYEQERERKRLASAKRGYNGLKELVGICVQMCPRWDRMRRANNKSAISTYEVDEDGYFGEDRAVKSWHRPAAGEAEDLPEDLRTEQTLMKTMDYLVHGLVDKWLFAGCQNFIWDRTRSIRQDCSIQGLNSDAVIECYERIARFHIFSIQQLSHNENFQRGQELEQLSKTLISLNELYDDRRRLIKQGKRQYDSEADFEAEFRAYTLVSNIYSPLQVSRAVQLPTRITETPTFKIALQLFKYAQRANHDDKNLFGNTSRSETTLNWSAQFFELVHDPSTPYLLACLAAMEFTNVKKGAIKTFERGFPPQKTASSLSLLKELVNVTSERDVKLAVERYGLKTTEQDGAIYMNSPRKSQPSTWIAQPPPMSPPFPLTVEMKRGQTTTGQFIPARFFIDEPGCYRRVVSQFCEEEVDIRYNDPVEHEPTTDGPVHIVQFASSWESVGTIVYDSNERVEGDPTADALFDLIQNTRRGNVPVTQAENLVSYIGQRRKGGKKKFVQAATTTFKSRAPQPAQRQAALSFQGFAKPAAPAAVTPAPPPQTQGQFKDPVPFPPVFAAQPPATDHAQEASLATNAPVASAFAARPAIVSAFGAPAPASAFGTRPQPALAFGVKPGPSAAAPAFGAKASTPPVPVFGARAADASSTVSAFGPKPTISDPAGVTQGVAPAPIKDSSPTPSSIPPPASVFSAGPAVPPVSGSLFAPPTLQATREPAATPLSRPDPSAPTSVFDQKPTTVSGTGVKNTSSQSLFDQYQALSNQATPQGLFPGVPPTSTTPSLFPSAVPSLDPSVPAFGPPQTLGPKPSDASIFGAQKSVPAQGSIFDQEPSRKPATSFFPASNPVLNQAAPAQQSAPSVFNLEPARAPVTSFFPATTTTTPAGNPPVGLFPSTTPQTQPPPAPIFEPAAPKAPKSSETNVSTAKENLFTPADAEPKIPQSEIKPPDEPEAIEEDEPEPPKPRLAPSGLPLIEDLPINNNDPLPPHRLTYRELIQDIAPEFFRKMDPSREPKESWYPGLDSLNKISYTDVRALADHRDRLRTAAWHQLTLAECNKDGLPTLLAQAAPDTWQLQLVCADESKTSLDWFMNKFEGLVEREGEETYRDLHVASSHMRGQDGCIGGVVFGCTAVAGRDVKEVKRALKHDKGVLKRTVANALRAAPGGKVHVLVLAYQAAGRTRKMQEDNVRKGLGVGELEEEEGKVSVRVLLLEGLEDLQGLHRTAKAFGVGLARKPEVSVVSNDNPPISANIVTKKRELEELEAQTAKLLLDAETTAMKRPKYGEDRGPAYIYGLPVFETPSKKTPAMKQQQQHHQPIPIPIQMQMQVQVQVQAQPSPAPLRKRRSAEDNSDAKKRKVKVTGERLSKALSSVSAKFDKWALPGDGEDIIVGDDSLTADWDMGF